MVKVFIPNIISRTTMNYKFIRTNRGNKIVTELWVPDYESNWVKCLEIFDNA